MSNRRILAVSRAKYNRKSYQQRKKVAAGNFPVQENDFNVHLVWEGVSTILKAVSQSLCKPSN